MVKPGGYFFISSIAKNRASYQNSLDMSIGEDVLNNLPQGTFEWESCVPLDTVEQYLNHNNCTTIGKTGAAISNPFTLEMVEIPYTKGNYLMM